MDETNNIIKVSNAFVDSLPSVGNEKSSITLMDEYSSHFKANYGKTKYYHGLIYSLSINLNDSLALRVCVESDNMNKLVFSKFLTETNYKEVFEEVDELISQFKNSCEVSEELRELCC